MNKQKQELNVYKMGYLPWCPINWGYNIKNFFRTLKWAKQRAVRGYADWDVWELHKYYTKLIANSLRTLAATTNGFPNGYTEVEWMRALNELADKFDIVDEEVLDNLEVQKAFDKVSAIYDKYREVNGDTISFNNEAPGYKEASKEWLELHNKVWNDKVKTLYDALNELFRIWFDLWD